MLQEKVKNKIPGSCNDGNCLDEISILGDPGKWSSPTLQIRAFLLVHSLCHGKNSPSLTELAVSTLTGHTNPRHQCHWTQCHQSINAPVQPLHQVVSNGWPFVLQNDGNYVCLQSWLYILHWRNDVGCAYSSLRLSSGLSKWDYS